MMKYEKGRKTRQIYDSDQKVLDQYVCEYEVNSAFYIKVEREKNQLVGVVPGNQRTLICAETEKYFYITGQYLRVHFVKDKTGRVIGFLMGRYEGESFVKKHE